MADIDDGRCPREGAGVCSVGFLFADFAVDNDFLAPDEQGVDEGREHWNSDAQSAITARHLMFSSDGGNSL
jgi:hypothetical protein